MKKNLLILIAVVCVLPAAFARDEESDSAEAWAGTWKRSDGGQTMTISFRGSTAIISYSKGTPDTGKLRGDGEIIDFEGSTHGGYDHSEGTLTLSADHTSITKNQKIFGQDGPERHLQATYVRSSQSRTASRAERDTGAGGMEESFAGVWQADDNPDSELTIVVQGREVIVTHAVGRPRTYTTYKGTLHSSSITYRVSSTQQATIQPKAPGQIIERVVSDNHTETETFTRAR